MLEKLHRIYTLIHKEILAVWSDPKSRTVLIVPPLMQLFIFAFAATLDVRNVPIGILNRDGGEAAFELVQRFNGSPVFNRIVYLQSVEEVQPFIDDQYGVMVLSIDEQFSRNLDAKKHATVQMIFDGRKPNTTQIVSGYAQNIIDQYNRDFAARSQIDLQHAQIIPRNWFNANLLYYWYNIPSLSGILTMLVGLLVTALSVARERELGTFDQLLVSPVSPLEILVGKTVPALIIGLMEGTVIIMVGVFLFQIPFTGQLPLLYLGMFVYLCAVIGVGLFISALCKTQQQAILGTFVFMTPAILLSGFATPIENMPTWLQYVTYVNPLRYYLIIAKGVFLKAMPAYIVIHFLWPLVLIAFCTLSGASWFFQRKLE